MENNYIHLHLYYCCPICLRRSREMELLLDRRHKPTTEEISARPDLALIIGQQVLKCPCGLEHTWFSLDEIREVFT